MKSQSALAAKAIKKELTTAFKGVKFSVKSENYSGGDSVTVNWYDGATVEAVEAIIKKYEYGKFDSMTDYYEYSNVIEGLPQTKYLFTNRYMSEKTETELKAYVRAKFPESYFEDYGFERSEMRKIFKRSPMPEINGLNY